jgi:hypothetical protein
MSDIKNMTNDELKKEIWELSGYNSWCRNIWRSYDDWIKTLKKTDRTELLVIYEDTLRFTIRYKDEIKAELEWFKNMGDYTDRKCEDIYKNIYVNCDARKLTEYENNLLNTIYTRSGNISKNPYVFCSGNKQ